MTADTISELHQVLLIQHNTSRCKLGVQMERMVHVIHHATNLALESGPLYGLTYFNELWLGYA